MRSKVPDYWAVAVAQLAERLLPIPEICGSNPVISKFLNCVEKTKIKKKRPKKAILRPPKPTIRLQTGIRTHSLQKMSLLP